MVVVLLVGALILEMRVCRDGWGDWSVGCCISWLFEPRSWFMSDEVHGGWGRRKGEIPCSDARQLGGWTAQGMIGLWGDMA